MKRKKYINILARFLFTLRKKVYLCISFLGYRSEPQSHNQ